jgi:hypothetical protein
MLSSLNEPGDFQNPRNFGCAGFLIEQGETAKGKSSSQQTADSKQQIPGQQVAESSTAGSQRILRLTSYFWLFAVCCLLLTASG